MTPHFNTNIQRLPPDELLRLQLLTIKSWLDDSAALKACTPKMRVLIQDAAQLLDLAMYERKCELEDQQIAEVAAIPTMAATRRELEIDHHRCPCGRPYTQCSEDGCTAIVRAIRK